MCRLLTQNSSYSRGCGPVRRGWQYSVSSNAEVLRSTTASTSTTYNNGNSNNISNGGGVGGSSAAAPSSSSAGGVSCDDVNKVGGGVHQSSVSGASCSSSNSSSSSNHNNAFTSVTCNSNNNGRLDATSSSSAGSNNINDCVDGGINNDESMADFSETSSGGVGLADLRCPGTDSDPLDSCPPNAHLIFIEPFCGGSHRQLLSTILSDTKMITSSEDAAVFTMSSKKWHWRARTSALTISQKIPTYHLYKVLFCSATLNLCELVGLRPDLARLHKVIYFHENQLVYPVRQNKSRDFQYGYNQIMSALVADCVLFNSQYNLESFLREVPRHLNLQKDGRPDVVAITSTIRTKSKVLYFPVTINRLSRPPKDGLEPLHIIWPHRWEHDKDPDTFFHVLFQLAETGLNFRVSVLGENFSETPPIFEEARQRLHNFIIHWGYAQTKDKYWQVLHSGDVVISTAHHEFFGVAMLEAVGSGCYPLCPNRLVYPEIYPQECLYNTQQQLFKALSGWCTRPQILRNKSVNMDLEMYSWATLRQNFMEVLGIAE